MSFRISMKASNPSVFQLTGEGLDTGIEFIFDGQNSSPPEDFIEFVELAILLTNPWYEEQLSTKTQRKSEKGKSARKNQ